MNKDTDAIFSRSLEFRGLQRVVLGWMLAIGAGALAGTDSLAQDAVKAEIIGFVFPIPDEQGGKTVISGERGRVFQDDTIDLSGVVVETFRGAEKEMIVEAEQCFFDRAERVVWSAGALTVRAASGQYSVKGKGFRWQGSDSNLVISNSVETILRKRDFQRNPGAGVIPKPPAVPTDGTDDPDGDVLVQSDRLQMRGTRALFKGSVRARESGKLLECGLLSVRLGDSTKGAEEIIAEDNVRFRDGEVQTTSRKAVYSVREDTVILTGDATWRIAEKEGSADTVTIQKGSDRIHAGGNVRLRLATREFVPLNWLPQTPGTQAVPEGAQLVEILADNLDYGPDGIQFEGNVRVQKGNGRFASDRLRMVFAEDNGRLTELHAEGNVRFEEGDSLAFGGRLDYDELQSVMTMSGNPGWRIPGGSGTSDRLVFDPATQRIQCDGNVVMRLSPQSGRWPDLSVVTRSNADAGASVVSEIDIEIRARKLFYKSTSAIFLGETVVILGAGSGRELRSEILAAFFDGPESTLDALVAEQNVVFNQPGLIARGEKIIHRVASGFTELKGHPIIQMEGTRYVADSFQIESASSLFRMKGNYRIEITPDAARGFEFGTMPDGSPN